MLLVNKLGIVYTLFDFASVDLTCQPKVDVLGNMLKTFSICLMILRILGSICRPKADVFGHDLKNVDVCSMCLRMLA
jgi:hypothetical protein